MDQLPGYAPRPNPNTIEPGVLSVFRTVVALQLGLAVVLQIIRLFSRDDGLPPGLPLLTIGWTLALLLYLFSTELNHRLGRFYLPLALTFATLCTMSEFVWEMQSLLAEVGPARRGLVIGVGGWRLLIGLLAPLVIIASQYDLRGVALFVAAILGAETAVFLWLVPERFPLLGAVLIHAVVFGLIGYIVNRTVSAQRAQRQRLAEVNEQLAQHAATLEQLTLSRERNRLARELHDTLAHTLSAVSVQLEAVDSAWHLQPDKAHELLVKSLAQTRSGLTETRRALQALRASPLDDLGLALAVRNLAESTAKRGGLKLELRIDELEPLGLEVEQQVYRIAQEALTNALKHSGADALRVAMTVRDGQLMLTVADNGRGIDTDALHANGQYGLRGMQERADLIGAFLEVNRGQQGATVRLRVPQG